MRTLLAKLFVQAAGWLRSKRMPSPSSGSSFSFREAARTRQQPTSGELLAELKNTAWTCVSINASVCANFPPRLFVRTRGNEPVARCLTQPLSVKTAQRLRQAPHLEKYTRGADRLEEVLDHPLLALLAHANPFCNAFDLWELTTLYQEVVGSTYWYLERGPLGVPQGVWILPSQNVTPKRAPDSRQPVDYYSYRTADSEQRFTPEEIIHFRYPDPRDPYTSGLSPLRACFEQACLTSQYTAFKQEKFAHHAIPDALVSPDEVLGEEERDRLETQWQDRFRRGGGKVIVAESALRVQLLNHSMGDLASLADVKATREEIANAFHIPLSFLTSETNLANLQAAEHQHMSKAISPRLKRRDEKLNEQLVPWFDPSGRLFLASEDPVPVNRELSAKEQELNLKYGVVTVNEVRAQQGLLPVPWGDTPWVPSHHVNA